jgi:hydrophobic/amphiphilic exporter-1 (mainly G- bacteria), HAE1 family
LEFSNQLYEKGMSLTKAALEACAERLRPILMTAIATMIGAVPLLVATGPGATARQSLGTAIVGGMLVATVLSLFVVPVLYIVIKTLALRYLPTSKTAIAAHQESAADDDLSFKHNGDGLARDPAPAFPDGDGHKSAKEEF